MGMPARPGHCFCDPCVRLPDRPNSSLPFHGSRSVGPRSVPLVLALTTTRAIINLISQAARRIQLGALPRCVYLFDAFRRDQLLSLVCLSLPSRLRCTLP